MVNASLEMADMGGAILEDATFAHAEMSEAYLGAAKAKAADLSNADLSSANLEEADFSEANLAECDLSEAKAPGTKFVGANLARANFTEGVLAGADLSGADLRGADFSQANLEGATLTGAKVFGAQFDDAILDEVVLEFVDASNEGDGSRRVAGDAAIELLRSGRPSAEVPGRRYFGKGDVMRNAALEFGDNSLVEIESRFEKCSIALGTGTELVIGQAGLLHSCTIEGAGNIVIHGTFLEDASPGIVGPRRVIVSSSGALRATVKQPEDNTQFAFEPGCRLRLNIVSRDDEKGR